MPWLKCQVEQVSRRADETIVGEFEGRTAYECTWLALCKWCRAWHFDSECQVLTVRHGERVWLVRQEKVRAWRPLVGITIASRVMLEARERDPQGRETPQPGQVW